MDELHHGGNTIILVTHEDELAQHAARSCAARRKIVSAHSQPSGRRLTPDRQARRGVPRNVLMALKAIWQQDEVDAHDAGHRHRTAAVIAWSRSSKGSPRSSPTKSRISARTRSSSALSTAR